MKPICHWPPRHRAALADRRVEVARLELALTDIDRRLVYYGDRRMGKSSAVEEAAVRARKQGHTVAVADLNVATGSDDATRRVGEAYANEGYIYANVRPVIVSKASI